MKIISIVGARPQFIKLAPLVCSLKEHNKSTNRTEIEHSICHTGQHYDYEMNKVFFDELGIPVPDYNLDVGSGSHGLQTGEMLKGAEEVLIKEQPDWVLVYGDTNSTLAGALAAAKLHIPVAHIEAGLRSYNKKMPEEINRVLADHCSDILFCPTENAVKNLKKEGFTDVLNNGKLIDLSSIKIQTTNSHPHIVVNVGDIMFDMLLMSLEIAEKKSTILKSLKLEPNRYYLATLHRAENTDDKKRLIKITEAFLEISREKPLVFPIHPRTKKILDSLDYLSYSRSQVQLIDPLSYFDMIILERNAEKILTDSGGVQKEAYLLETPCITLRDETEWIETVKCGWNVLVGADKGKIKKFTLTQSKSFSRPKKIFGDGEASNKIIRLLISE